MTTDLISQVAEIERRLARMLAHLERLRLNGDLSQDDYDAALRDLSAWEEAAMLEAIGEETS